jgi:hypothetical protein
MRNSKKWALGIALVGLLALIPVRADIVQALTSAGIVKLFTGGHTSAAYGLATDGSQQLFASGSTPAIGGPLTGGTAGAVLFVDPMGGLFAQDPTNFFYSSIYNCLFVGLGNCSTPGLAAFGTAANPNPVSGAIAYGGNNQAMFLIQSGGAGGSGDNGLIRALKGATPMWDMSFILNGTPDFYILNRVSGAYDFIIRGASDLLDLSGASMLKSPIFQDAASGFGALTDGAIISWNVAGNQFANTYVVFTVDGGSRTLNVSNLYNGGNYTLEIIQDGSGVGEGLILGTGCTWAVIGGGAGAITPSTAPGAVDVLAFTYNGGTCLATFGKNYN